MGAGAFENKILELQSNLLFTDGTYNFQKSEASQLTHGALSGRLLVNFASIEAVAITTAIKFMLQGRSGSDQPWFDLTTALSTATSTADANQLNGALSAGSEQLTLDDSTGFGTAEYGFIKDAVLANSEWFRVDTNAANQIRTLDPLVYAHLDNTLVYSNAERLITAVVDFSGIYEVRCTVQRSASGPDFVWNAVLAYVAGQN